MTIEITSPDVEVLIQQRIQAGLFKNPDVIREALRSSLPDIRIGAALIAAMQSCPYLEIDIEPPRVPTPLVRDVTSARSWVGNHGAARESRRS